MNTIEEEKFRKRRQWTSFKASVYSALSHASFIGLLGMVVQQAVETASAPGGFSAALSTLATNPLPMLVVGAAMAAGVLFSYIAQNEWTDLKVMEDDHLAQRNAECNALEKAKAKPAEKTASPEHEQNCRADGKKWVDNIPANQNLVAAR